jgi:hypothetical protein
MHIVSSGTYIGITKSGSTKSGSTTGGLYKTTIDISAITGTFKTGDGVTGITVWTTAGNGQTSYVTSVGTSVYLMRSTACNATCDNWKHERVTMPAATGALLLSSYGGSRGYVYKSASFDPNVALSYKIVKVID